MAPSHRPPVSDRERLLAEREALVAEREKREDRRELIRTVRMIGEAGLVIIHDHLGCC